MSLQISFPARVLLIFSISIGRRWKCMVSSRINRASLSSSQQKLIALHMSSGVSIIWSYGTWKLEMISNSSVDLSLNIKPSRDTMSFIVKRPSRGTVARKSVHLARMIITKLIKTIWNTCFRTNVQRTFPQPWQHLKGTSSLPGGRQSGYKVMSRRKTTVEYLA